MWRNHFVLCANSASSRWHSDQNFNSKFFAKLRDAPHKANRHKSNNFPTLTQNKPYTYLGIHLMPSLKWNLQKEIALQKTKLQCKLLTLSPASLKQKMKILNTIIKLHISYVYYAVSFSKLDI